MTPTLLILIILATIAAALAHLIWGQRWLQLPVFMVAALAGALIVYALQLRIPGLETPQPADVPAIEALLGALLLVAVASRLKL